MHTITRRSFLAGAAIAASPWPAQGAADPEKTAFIKAAFPGISPPSLTPGGEAKFNEWLPQVRTEVMKQGLEIKPHGIQTLCVPIPFADWDYYYTDGVLL